MGRRRPGPRPAAAAAAASAILTTSVFFFIVLLRSPGADGAAGAATVGGQVVTNQFHVVVKRHADNGGEGDLRGLADDIATEHGFHNLGPVS